MFKILKLTLLLITISNFAYANNVLTIQKELTPKQIDWINKHRPNQKVGMEFQYVYFRESSGHVWSVSLNEYKKSKYFNSNDLEGFFSETINLRLDQETNVLVDVLDKSTTMLFDLIDDGMSEKSAFIIVSNTYPQLSTHDGLPIVRSNKLPMVSIKINYKENLRN